MKIKEILKISSLPIFFASLCCLGPVILVALGLSTISLAASLADNFYENYRWVFRGVGLLTLGVSIFYYLRRNKNICSINEAKRRRNEIINTIALIFIVSVLGYLFFLYVVVHYIGVFLNIWS